MWFLTFLQWWLSNVAYHFFISKNYSYAFLWTVSRRSAFFNIHKYSYTYAKLETNFIFFTVQNFICFSQRCPWIYQLYNQVFIICQLLWVSFVTFDSWMFHLLHRIIVCWYYWINWVSIYKARNYSKLTARTCVRTFCICSHI